MLKNSSLCRQVCSVLFKYQLFVMFKPGRFRRVPTLAEAAIDNNCLFRYLGLIRTGTVHAVMTGTLELSSLHVRRGSKADYVLTTVLGSSATYTNNSVYTRYDTTRPSYDINYVVMSTSCFA